MEVNSDFKYTENGYIIKKDDGSEEVLQIPYNLNNIFITEDDIIKLLKNYNVYINKINHLKYFQQAFVHKSYCKKNLIPQDILEKSKQIINALNGIGPRDEKFLGKGVLKQYGIAKNGYNVVSNQFSIHYFFENYSTFSANC